MSDSDTVCPFAWVGLASSDTARAGAFYAELFGWGRRQLVTGRMGTVSVLTLDGNDVALLYAQTREARAASAAPHWTPFISVPDADEAVARAAGHGAVVLRPPFDVLDEGRVATLRDPAGVVVSLWQPLAATGAALVNSLYAHCSTELSTGQLARSKSFYGAVFGWRFERDSSGCLHVVDLPGPRVKMRLRLEGEPVAEGWLPHFMVENVQQTAARAHVLGGRDLGRSAAGVSTLIADPTGATFAVVEATSRRPFES